MRFAAAVAVLALACMGMLGCEPPNHVDASADGSTMYFALGPTARWGVSTCSQLYAFDVENCRLRMLADDPRMNTWVSGNDDGSRFAFTRCYSQSEFDVIDQKTGDTRERTVGEIYNSYGASTFIPGGGWQLCVEGRVLELLRWTLIDDAGRAVAPPWDKARDFKAVGTGTPALMKNRCAVAVWGLNPDYPKTTLKPYGVWIYVLDVSGAAPTATLAGRWDAHYHEIPLRFIDGPTIDLAFSPDGSKIVASWYSLLKTTFWELDAAGKEKPKELFSDAKALRPVFMSDGKTVAYLRQHSDPVKWNAMQLMLKQPGAKALRPVFMSDGKTVAYLRQHSDPVKWNAMQLMLRKPDARPEPVAELPGRINACGTALRRLADGRLRAMHLSDSGITVVECAADGSAVKTKALPLDRLETQRRLARFEHVFKQNPPINQYQAPWDVLKFVKVPTPAGEKREDDVARSLEKAFEETKTWKPAAAAK